MTLSLEEDKVRDLLRDALLGLLKDQPELFHEIILEAIEDAGLLMAIKEGKESGFATRSEIDAILEGRAWKPNVIHVLLETWKRFESDNSSRECSKLILLVEQADSSESIPGIKKLQAEGDFFRIRMGDYRIGIEITGETVIFVRFLHRKDIYRNFP